MGGGHGHGEGTTYKGFTVHQPKRWHTVTGKGLCAIMWFWVLYRAKQDGPVVLVMKIILMAMKNMSHLTEKMEAISDCRHESRRFEGSSLDSFTAAS
ncbi:hypothetical protein SAY87_022186 [Trapa incisa]|uniref:NADH dehydrogenase [ubiquinone] 1 beta subcomplex subunit 2 n=1 Tax=Trapa incisa TaxID=236973 RepID=A0AAN7JSW1_9MYRT|nr:hypothetical protein SAY87_022186 [Trapa incisa]